jgi:histone-lysine N-methyltransferase SETDB1
MFVQNVFVDTHDPRFTWLALFTTRDVFAGEELCWDYGYEVGTIPGRKIICYCGSSNCRGRLL